MESARVAFASSLRTEQLRNPQKCRYDLCMSSSLGYVKCFLCECVHTAVQQTVYLDHESLHTHNLYKHVHAHTHGPAATGTADSANKVTCVYTVSSSMPKLSQ